MRISALRLFNVKRFAGRGVAIEGVGEGVNVLCAPNEYGKSTSFEALHALFFQPYSGTPREVQRLRPYAGGNPRVEADIETAEGRFRITKQYYGGRFARVVDLAGGRLVAQADEAERFIAGLIKGGTAGPAGLLWVRQGVTGIEKRGASEEESEKQVRAGLLESVQGEVEAITGGRRMAEIMAATEGALAELVTATGRPKAGGRYAAALDDRERLAAGEQRLAADVAALREALDGRASSQRQLADLDRAGDRQGRRRAVEAAEAALQAAQAQRERLNTAEAEHRLLRERRDIAARERETFRAALGNADAIAGRIEEAARRRDEARRRRVEAAAAIEAASREAQSAEAREQELRDLLARLEAALRAREASQRHAGEVERLRAAEAAREAVETGEAEFALAKLSPADIEALQAAELEIVRLRASEETGRPTVTIAYENDAAPRVHMGGTPLAAGEGRSFEGEVPLALPGIGTLTLRADRPARTGDGLAKAEARRAALLRAMNVADLDAARARQERARQIELGLREARGRLSLLAPEGLAKLREAVAALGAVDAALLEVKADPAPVRTDLAAAEEQRKAARLALREVEPRRAAADEAFVEAETALTKLEGERGALDTVLGPAGDRETRGRALADALDALEREHARAEAHAASLRTEAADIESAEAALRRARSVETAATQEIATLRETIAGLNAAIGAKADQAVEETWRETADALAAATQRADAFEREVKVLQRLAAALEAARSEARELYLGPVMAELRPLLALLFDDVSITFDEKTLLPGTILRNGQQEEVDRLSGGMREQLSVLTRLAFARLFARDGRPAPVILDDALVYSDDDRIEKMFDALHRQSRDQQIIVFSCRQRAFQRLGGQVLRMTDWRPDEA